jgi:hypothetical protein
MLHGQQAAHVILSIGEQPDTIGLILSRQQQLNIPSAVQHALYVNGRAACTVEDEILFKSFDSPDAQIL